MGLSPWGVIVAYDSNIMGYRQRQWHYCLEGHEAGT